MNERVSLTINGNAVELELDGTRPLLSILREDLSLRGSRFGCGAEHCGACMVLIDGEPEYSCATRGRQLWPAVRSRPSRG